MGVVTPVGTGVEKFWNSLCNGECGIAEAKGYYTEDLRVKIAGEVKDFDPETDLSRPHIQRADKFSQFIGKAADEAIQQSGIEVPFADGRRVSCILGTGAGGLTTLENSYEDLFRHGKTRSNPLTLIRTLCSSAPAHLSMEYNITGPVFSVVSACASSSHAMGLTYRMIRDGVTDTGITGGSEASLNWGATKSWEALFVLSPNGCFPFSSKRNGTVLAEGGGVVIMEEFERAKERGANIIAEVKGFGMTADAGDMVNPTVEGPSNAMLEALTEAELSCSDIDYINAHGTATRVNDVNETNAIKAVFDREAFNVAISSTKSMHGHLLGGGGVIEAVASIKAIEDNFIPPTINLEEPDPKCDLDYTPNKGKSRNVSYAMSNSLAFGGLNTVLIFGEPPAY
jgi:nodulation protein E